MLQKILSFIDNANIAEAFAEIDKANIQSPSISQLKKEFIMGRTGFDFYDRFKMAVKNELKEENHTPNEINVSPSIDLRQLYQKLNNKLNDENLNLFCMLHFNSVYNNFSQGQSKTIKITALLDYAKRNNLLELLENELNSFQS
jgi:hypothetical protein